MTAPSKSAIEAAEQFLRAEGWGLDRADKAAFAALLDSYAAARVAEEREACARIADNIAEKYQRYSVKCLTQEDVDEDEARNSQLMTDGAREVRDAIRARSKGAT